MLKREKYFWLLLLILFSIVISRPLLSSEQITFGHDLMFHVGRIEGMAESLSGGQFPVRIVGKSFNGYGEASGFFYPNLFFYIPAALRLLGVPIVVCFNAFGLLINLATVLISFWIFERLFNSSKHAAVCAMLYGGFLYRLSDLYVRCALGEALAMTFMPLALISLWLMINRDVRLWSAVVVGFTGVLQSHILSSLLMLAAAFLISIVSFERLRRRDVLISIAKAVAFTFAINLWFYVPFVDMYGRMHFHMQDALNLAHQLSSEAFTANFFVGMQMFCGWAIVAFMLAYLIKVRRPTPAWLILSAIGLLTLIASTDFFPWTLIEDVFGASIGVLQFPFRLITFGAIALSIAAGIALVELRLSMWLLAICCFCAANVNVSFLEHVDSDLWKIGRDQTTFNEIFYSMDHRGYFDYVYSDLTQDDVVNADSTSKLPRGAIEPREVVEVFFKRGTTIEFTARTNEPTLIRLPLFYYPGYSARTSDGEELSVQSVDKHRLAVEVPRGATSILVEYVGRRLWIVDGLISLVALILFVVQARRETS